MDEGEILAISRAVERPLITVFCGMSIFLGYHLFKLGILESQKGTISVSGWKVSLEKVGPGVFFALFGMIGLVFGIAHSFSDNGLGSSSANYSRRTVSSLGSGADDLRRKEVRALDVVIDPPKNGDDVNNEALNAALVRNRPYLTAIRRQLLLEVFNSTDLDAWDANKDAFHNRQIEDKGLNERLSRIAPYMEGTN